MISWTCFKAQIPNRITNVADEYRNASRLMLRPWNRLRLTSVLLSLCEICLRGNHVFAEELHQVPRFCRVPQQRSLNWILLFAALLSGGVPAGDGAFSPTTHARKKASLVGHGTKWRNDRHWSCGHAFLIPAWTHATLPLQQPMCHSEEVLSYAPLCRSSTWTAGNTSHRSGIGKAKARGLAHFWAKQVRCGRDKPHCAPLRTPLRHSASVGG